jgi:hypothetical protein
MKNNFGHISDNLPMVGGFIWASAPQVKDYTLFRVIEM